jgi:hypothetical protein
MVVAGEARDQRGSGRGLRWRKIPAFVTGNYQRVVFTDDLLYIHVPTTAGMAVSDALLRALPTPVYYAVQKGHEGRYRRATVIEGRRHQRLADADAWFAEQGLPHRVASFRHVLAMVRNPYALEVSRYHYLRKGHAWDAGKAQDLALSGDFAAFVRGSRWWFDFADYYSIDGRVPPNLRVLRQESFYRELESFCADAGVEKLPLEHVNASRDQDYRDLIDDDLEALVYAKYRYLFDRGFYSRESFSTPPGRGA